MRALKPLDVVALAIVWAGLCLVVTILSWIPGPKEGLGFVVVAGIIAAYYLSKWIILKKGD